MKKDYYAKLLYMISLVLVILMMFSYATYAWFSDNRQVENNRVSVSSGSQQLDLQISNEENGTYADMAEIFIDQNGTLDPISSVDLESFYKPITVTEQGESNFIQIDKGYYKEELYLRTTAEGFASTDTMQLYIDTDGMVMAEGESKVDAAVRVGLIFSYDGRKEMKILSFDTNEQENTVVAAMKEGAPVYEKDPAESIVKYTIQEDGNRLMIPEEYLVELPLNKVCKVEVFCYLEGNDEDCKNPIREHEMFMQIPFYGVLANEGDAS